MNVSFTATRPPKPANTFTVGEEDLIVSQLDDLPRGTRIGQGGCIGGDVIIARAAWERGMYVVTFLPARYWRDQTARDIDRWSHEVIDTGKDLPSRNYEIVAFGEKVRAIALYEEYRQPRSGTWKTIRIARRCGKLDRVVTLRPLQGRPPEIEYIMQQ